MSHVIRSRILDRVTLEKEKNALILVVGDPGTGKSDGCNSFGLILDPTYNPKRVAHKTAERFVHILNNDPTLKRGCAVHWDDAGKGLKSDEWYKEMNRIVRDILQTFRIDGLIVFINCPDPSFIDKKVLKLFDYWMETSRIDYENKLLYCRFYEIDKNKKTGKIYWHRPKYRTPDGTLRRIDHLVIPKAPDWFDREYRKMKLITNREIKIDTEKKLRAMREEEKKKMLLDSDIIKEITSNIRLYTNEYNSRQFIDPFLIMNEFNIGRPRACKIKAVVEKMPVFKQ